jgi:hypothetical protein
MAFFHFTLKLSGFINQKKIRRLKAAKSLYKKNDDRIIGYEKRPLLKLLTDRLYHSPEISETDDDGSQTINVYNLSWRSDEVTTFILFWVFSLFINFN